MARRGRKNETLDSVRNTLDYHFGSEFGVQVDEQQFMRMENGMLIVRDRATKEIKMQFKLVSVPLEEEAEKNEEKAA